jgi:hypothetical protein
VDDQVAAAARGLVLVFVAALAFFGFIVGSGILGALGQAVLGLVLGAAALLFVWCRLDPSTRRRVVNDGRRSLRRVSTAAARRRWRRSGPG